MVLRIPPPEPPARYLVTDFSFRENGVEQPVTLPHFTASRYTMNDPPLYSGRFTWPDISRGGEPQGAWSIMLPRFTNAVEVAVNGVVILDSRRNPAANRPDRNTPEIAVIPASLLRDGANDLSIRLFVWGPIKGFLDRLYVGPDAELRPSYGGTGAAVVKHWGRPSPASCAVFFQSLLRGWQKKSPFGVRGQICPCTREPFLHS